MLDDVLRSLLALFAPGRLEQLKRNLLQRVVLTVEAEIKATTPVRTGHLRRSITGEVQSVDRGVVGTNLIYAPIVNRRNPYMQRGLDAAEPTIDRLLGAFGLEWSNGS